MVHDDIAATVSTLKLAVSVPAPVAAPEHELDTCELKIKPLTVAPKLWAKLSAPVLALNALVIVYCKQVLSSEQSAVAQYRHGRRASGQTRGEQHRELQVLCVEL